MVRNLYTVAMVQGSQRRPVAFAILYGIRAGIFIWHFHEKLTPDTAEFAHGLASWSSLVAATAGKIAGVEGVRVFGLIGAISLGWLLGKYTRGFVPLIIFLLPPGWYSIQASADAAGAAAGLLAIRARGPKIERVAAVSAFHAAGGLVFAASAIFCGRGKWGRFAPILASGLCCLLMVHFQMRYFLPGIVIYAAIAYPA